MPIAKLLLDSSALFSGIASPTGAARALLVLSETGRIQTVISEQVIVETEAPDVPIVLSAMMAQVDFLVTFNRRHFIDDPGVAQRSGLRIGDPGDALTWVRQQLATSG